jgi:hypothetical protein
MNKKKHTISLSLSLPFTKASLFLSLPFTKASPFSTLYTMLPTFSSNSNFSFTQKLLHATDGNLGKCINYVVK